MKTIIALTIATLFAATAARAEVVTKGGATGLTKAPAVQTQAPVRIAMDCAKCKSEYVALTRRGFKGAAPVTTTVERHGCAACGNKWITSGHGKAKVETAIHTCNDCKS